MPDKAIESRRSAGEPCDPNPELDFLCRLGETIGATSDADLIPGIALKASLEITDADLGAIILLEDDGWRVAAASEQIVRDIDDLVARVVSAHGDRLRPAVITELPVVSKPYGSLLWATLIVAETARRDPAGAPGRERQLHHHRGETDSRSGRAGRRGLA